MRENIKRMAGELLFGRQSEYEKEDGLFTYVETGNARSVEDSWRDFAKYGKDSFIAGVVLP